MKPAFFLDRDGVINEDVGYLSLPQQITLINGASQAIQQVNKAGFPVVVITNQAGIARGFFPEERLSDIHRHLDALLKASGGAYIDRYYYCPHHPLAGNPPYNLDCSCRKPRPGMLLQASEELELELENSLMVGDKESDLLAGINAGCRTALVRTGFGLSVEKYIQNKAVYQNVHIVDSILEAADTFLSGLG